MGTMSSVAMMADEDRVLGNVMRRLLEEVPCSLSDDTFTIAGVELRMTKREAALLRFVVTDG